MDIGVVEKWMDLFSVLNSTVAREVVSTGTASAEYDSTETSKATAWGLSVNFILRVCMALLTSEC